EDFNSKRRVTIDDITMGEGEQDAENAAEEVINLTQEDSAQFRDDLVGHATCDEVEVEIGHEDHSHDFKLVIKKVEKLHKAELTDAFAKEQSNEEAKNTDEYRSLIKGRIE